MLGINEVLHGRYKIIRQLGKGGMGAVYEAHDNVFDTTIALKEILIDLSRNSTPAQKEMLKLAFEREGKILAKVKHEVFPHVRDYFQDTNGQFLVMELVDGDDLAELLDKRGAPFPVEDVANWSEQLLDALDYLHTLEPPIIHRDIKPQNLKLTSRGKVKLLDFGIAKGNDTQQNTTITNETFIAATLHYSPLEQIYRVLDPTFREVIAYQFKDQAGAILQQNADARSDIYALGATIYHLLTNTLPIDALKRSLEIWAGKSDPLPNAYALNPQIPPSVSACVHRAMDIEHGKRFESAKEMRAALHEAFMSEKAREEESKRAAWIAEQQKMETERASILQERQRIEAEREKHLSQIEARNRQAELQRKQTEAATVQMDRNDLNVSNSPNVSGDSNVPKTQTFNQPSVETIAAPAKFAVNLPATQTPASPITQTDFMPQTFKSEPPKKSRKMLWLVPVFAVLFVMLGGAVFGVWMWQKNSAATDSNTIVANTANTANANSNSAAETVAEQGDTSQNINSAETNQSDNKTIVETPPEPVKKTTTAKTSTVATRPAPPPTKPKTVAAPPKRIEGATSRTNKPVKVEGAGPRN